MKFYVQVHDPLGEFVMAFEGMDQATVTALVAERSTPYDFIDEATYAAFLLAHQPVKPTAPQMLAQQRTDAVNSLMTDPSPLAKEIRGALLLILDEFNILRKRDRDRADDVAASGTFAALKTAWAARPALADRSNDQIKTGIQGKITTGTAD